MSGMRKHSCIVLEVRGRDVVARDVEVSAVFFCLTADAINEDRPKCKVVGTATIADDDSQYSISDRLFQQTEVAGIRHAFFLQGAAAEIWLLG